MLWGGVGLQLLSCSCPAEGSTHTRAAASSRSSPFCWVFPRQFADNPAASEQLTTQRNIAHLNQGQTRENNKNKNSSESLVSHPSLTFAPNLLLPPTSHPHPECGPGGSSELARLRAEGCSPDGPDPSTAANSAHRQFPQSRFNPTNLASFFPLKTRVFVLCLFMNKADSKPAPLTCMWLR